MPKLNANLTMMFTEVDFLQRFGRAAEAGFEAVEFLFPYGHEKARIADELGRHGLELVLHNLPSGNFEQGERGVAALPERVGEFQAGVGQGIEYAKALGCTRLNCLAGIRPPAVPDETMLATLVDNLRFAAQALEKEGIRLLVEPLNSQDVPGFYLTRSRQALEIFSMVEHPNLWLQYDIYHMQIMEGNLTRSIRDHLPSIGHMQLADNPGRHEPGTGEINFGNLLQFIDEAGYDGWIGCEYNPAAGTEAGLGWAGEYLKQG